jgi:hypothetical protein
MKNLFHFIIYNDNYNLKHYIFKYLINLKKNYILILNNFKKPKFIFVDYSY